MSLAEASAALGYFAEILGFAKNLKGLEGRSASLLNRWFLLTGFCVFLRRALTRHANCDL
jgi:hypothetical protein